MPKKGQKKKQKRQKPSVRILKSGLHLLLIALFLAGMSILLTWFLQYKYYSGNSDLTWEFFLNHVEIFWYSALIVFTALALISAIVERPFIVASIFWSVAAVASFANQNKMLSRGEPLFPEDLEMLGNTGELANMVDQGALVRMIISIILILALGILLNFLAHKIWSFDKNLPWWRRHAIIQRILLAVGLGCVLINITQPLFDSKNVRHDALAEQLKLHITAWDQKETYDGSSFLMGFLINSGRLNIEESAYYSVSAIESIAQKYNDKKAEDEDRKNLIDLADNVLVVLSESSFDPEVLDQYLPHSGGEITPNLHKIIQNYPNGKMYSPAYGGGTANVEAEVFSGLTNYWAGATLYSDIFITKNIIPSVATFTKKHGYDEAVVIHSYNGGFYRRGLALEKQGFDQFITIENMRYHSVYDSGYISDSSIYHEAIDYLKEHDSKEMLGLITMQNHTPYTPEAYSRLNFRLYNKKRGELSPIEAYYQTLHDSDQALGDFIEALDELDEKTVMLWYGDHSGGVFNELREQDDAMVDLTQQTPYFIYANFDLGDVNYDLPTTTPNCLLNTMYNVLDAQKPTMGYLLDEVCATNPILTKVYLRDNEPNYDEALEEYQMVNYDLMVGKQYWLDYAEY